MTEFREAPQGLSLAVAGSAGTSSLAEGIDATTPAGKLQMHLLGAIAEFEQAQLAERVTTRLATAWKQDTRLGRPETVVSETVLAPVTVRELPVREAARRRGTSPTTAYRWLIRKTA